MREKDLPHQAPRPHPTLCALVGNGDFDDYFAFHLQQEKQRNHDGRYRGPEPARRHNTQHAGIVLS